jgi:molybdenum cofactor cytidylyltransferase
VSSFAAIVLAAGRASRMGENKLVAELGGKAIVRRAAEAAVASKASPVIVVTGHERERVEATLAGLGVVIVHNPRYADGMSTSLKAGLAALPPNVEAVAILLGDMPEVDGALVDKLAAAIDPAAKKLIAIPVREGRQGNPVVWARALFSDLAKIEGDHGAKSVIAAHRAAVAEVAADAGAFSDVDTPAALAALRARQKGA